MIVNTKTGVLSMFCNMCQRTTYNAIIVILQKRQTGGHWTNHIIMSAMLIQWQQCEWHR